MKRRRRLLRVMKALKGNRAMKGRRLKASKGTSCRGEVSSGGDCKLARSGPYPIVLNKACVKCGEWRCRSHCLCARRGEVCGLSTPKSPKAKTLAKRSQLDVQVFPERSWLTKAIAEVQVSSEVVLASMQFDEPLLHAVLLRRLEDKKRGRFSCRVLVDKEKHDDNSCYFQNGRLKSLKAAGAEVFTSTGRPGSKRGHMHIKALVIDSEVAYVGSCNFTLASKHSFELMLRLTGPIVADALNAVEGCISGKTAAPL